MDSLFEYDANGNMTTDGSTGVGIEYNILGLPQKIFADGAEISYIYAADGRKIALARRSVFRYVALKASVHTATNAG